VIFTRTISRKLALGLGLVFLMLIALAGSAHYGLSAFRAVVHELDYSINEAPHQTDLVHAVSHLVDPVLRHVSPSEERAEVPGHFQFALDNCRSELAVFRTKLEAFAAKSPEPQRIALVNTTLDQIEQGLVRLDQLHAMVDDNAARPTTVRQMHELVSELLVSAQSVPDPVAGLQTMVSDSRKVYRSAYTGIVAALVVALVIFALLLGYTWSAVYVPLQRLHDGVRLVHGGEFDYRLPITTNDEMADVARSFNMMTERFQETCRDLDRQVDERSQQLVRSERLAGVGYLAAGVAHEINNPLSAICMAAESLEGRIQPLLANDDPGEAEIVLKYLAMMQTESFRCRQITERLLDFSRGRDHTREPVDIVSLIHEVLAMVSYLTKYREKTISFAASDTCIAEVNGAEIKQVVLNLVANGLEAMEKGGTLTIHMIQRTDQVLLEFRDDGCGMSPEVLDHIFEPFFTSKHGGQGTGLGLSISHRIVQQHGGTICAKSAGPGTGSTMTVCLPRRANLRSAA